MKFKFKYKDVINWPEVKFEAEIQADNILIADSIYLDKFKENQEFIETHKKFLDKTKFKSIPSTVVVSIISS